MIIRVELQDKKHFEEQINEHFKENFVKKHFGLLSNSNF